MLVLRVAVVMFVKRSTPHIEFSQQAGIDEFSQGSVDSRSADMPFQAFSREPLDQLVRVEVVVLAEDFVDQVAPLFGIAHPATLQVFIKSLSRR